MKEWILAAAAALALPACVSAPAAECSIDPWLPASAAFLQDAPAAGDEGGPSAVDVGHTIVMYIPNRVLDLFDTVRAGVNVGPGIGGQLKATDPAQVMFLSRISAGVGVQSLRHLPAYASVENAACVGPLGGDANIGIGWYQSPTDIRVEIHPFIVGAHIAVDPLEIADFVLGFFTVDIRKDDY